MFDFKSKSGPFNYPILGLPWLGQPRPGADHLWGPENPENAGRVFAGTIPGIGPLHDNVSSPSGWKGVRS